MMGRGEFIPPSPKIGDRRATKDYCKVCGSQLYEEWRTFPGYPEPDWYCVPHHGAVDPKDLRNCVEALRDRIEKLEANRNWNL